MNNQIIAQLDVEPQAENKNRLANSAACDTAKQQDTELYRQQTKDEIDRIKQLLNDRFRSHLLPYFGIEPYPKGNIHCPNPQHEDNHPSCQVNDTYLYCHVEGIGWDALGLIELLTGERDFWEKLKIGLQACNEIVPDFLDGGTYTYTYTYTPPKKQKPKPIVPKIQSVDGRDRAYQKLRDRLSLTPQHYQNLKNRGLTDSQIEAGGYLSVRKWADLGDLPTPYSDGFLCPVRQYGKVVGAQIRTADKRNKYKWLGTDGASKLSVGEGETESPISILLGNDTDTAWLSEGFLKTDIIHTLTGQTCIGAAGGNWATAQHQLKDFIDRYHPKEFRIFADAESVSNPAVASRTLRQIEKLKELGVARVYVADYGQLTDKDLPSPDDWLVSLENPSDWEQKITLLSETKFKVKGKQFKSDEAWTKDWEKWVKLNSLSNQTIIPVPDGQWFSDVCPLAKEGEFTFLAPPTATGKTTWVKRVKNYFDVEGKGIILIAPTQNAARQAAEDLGIHYFQDYKDNYYLDNPDVSFVLCLASLHLLEPHHFKNRVVVFDEITATIRQLKDFKELLKSVPGLSGVERYQLIFENFKAAIAESFATIGLDAFLVDIYLNWLSGISKKPIKIYNTQHRIRGQVYITSNLDTLLDVSNKLIDKNKTIAYCSDQRKSTKVFADKYHIKFPNNEITLVNSRSLADDKSLKDFVRQPTKELEERQTKLFSYSPSMLTGGDVQYKFDYQFAELTGVVGVDLLCQQPRRCRQIKEIEAGIEGRFYYVPEKSSIPIEMVAPGLLVMQWNYKVETGNRLVDDADLDFFADLDWSHRFASKNLRKCFEFFLNRDGYEAIEIETPETLKDLEYAAEFNSDKKRVNQAEFQQFASVPLVDDSQVEELKKQDSKTTIDADKIHKHYLAKSLPGLPAELLDSPEYLYWILEMKPALRTQWLYKNSEDPKVKQWQDSRLKENKVAPQQHKSNWLEAIALKQLGLENLPEKFTRSSKEVQAVVRAYQRSKDCQLALRITAPNKGQEIKFLKRLLEKIGYSLSCRQKKVNGKNINYYSMAEGGRCHIKNSEDWAIGFEKKDPTPIDLNAKFIEATLPAIARWHEAKLSEYLEYLAEIQSQQEIDQVADVPSLYNNQEDLLPFGEAIEPIPEKQPQIQSQQNLDQVVDPPNLYNNQEDLLPSEQYSNPLFDTEDFSYDPLFEDAPDEIFGEAILENSAESKNQTQTQTGQASEVVADAPNLYINQEHLPHLQNPKIEALLNCETASELQQTSVQIFAGDTEAKKQTWDAMSADQQVRIKLVATQTDEALEEDMWSMVWNAIAFDDKLETFGYIWQSVKAMGQRFADLVADELGDLVREVDPYWHSQLAF